ncbi:MAG: hypothetical protein ACRDDY_13060 [Clostridium sp.]|uniref:hypothetical protein n=1 Tax=Clostridium sp. TaxID=1506 RepID=UPI003EE637E6
MKHAKRENGILGPKYKIYEKWEDVIAANLDSESKELLFLLDQEEYHDMKKYGGSGDYVPKHFVADAENKAHKLELEVEKLNRDVERLTTKLKEFDKEDPYKERVTKYYNYALNAKKLKEQMELRYNEIKKQNKIIEDKSFEIQDRCEDKLNNAYDIVGRWKEKYEKLKSQKIRNYKKTESITADEFSRGFDCYKGTQYYDLRDVKMRKKHYVGKENIVLPIPDTTHVEIVKEYIFNGENGMINEIILPNRKNGYCDIIGLRTNPYYEMWELVLGQIDKK